MWKINFLIQEKKKPNHPICRERKKNCVFSPIVGLFTLPTFSLQLRFVIMFQLHAIKVSIRWLFLSLSKFKCSPENVLLNYINKIVVVEKNTCTLNFSSESHFNFVAASLSSASKLISFREKEWVTDWVNEWEMWLCSLFFFFFSFVLFSLKWEHFLAFTSLLLLTCVHCEWWQDTDIKFLFLQWIGWLH